MSMHLCKAHQTYEKIPLLMLPFLALLMLSFLPRGDWRDDPSTRAQLKSRIGFNYSLDVCVPLTANQC